MNSLGKRGQSLSTTAIVLIILAVIVLVILIAGFAIGWSKFLPFLSSNNVDTVVTSCTSACGTQSVYGFCTREITLKAEDGEISGVTCYELSTGEDYKKYGIAECTALTQDCENRLAS